MNILILHQYFSIEGTGSQTRLFELGRQLVAGGHQVTAVTGNSRLGLELGKKKIGLLQKDGLAIVVFNLDYSPQMKTGQKRRVFLSFARQASRQGRRLPRPDLIVASSPPLTAALPALSLSRFYRAPLVLEVRELWPDAVVRRGTLRNKTLIKLARRLEQKAYRQAALIITPRQGIADAIKENAVEQRKIAVLPDHLDPAELTARFGKLLTAIQLKQR